MHLRHTQTRGGRPAEQSNKSHNTKKKDARETSAIKPAAWAAIGLIVESPGAAGQPACTVISAGVWSLVTATHEYLGNRTEFYSSRQLYGGGSRVCVYFVYVYIVLWFIGFPWASLEFMLFSLDLGSTLSPFWEPLGPVELQMGPWL